MRRYRIEIEDVLIQRLVEFDPVEAWNVLSVPREGDTSRSVERRTDQWVRSIFARLASTDLDQAQKLAASLPPDSFSRRQAVEAVIEHAEIANPGSLLAWAKATLPGFDGYGDAGRDFTDMCAYMITPDNGIFARWAKSDLAAAKAYVFNLDQGRERHEGLVGIAEALCVTDPDAAVAFAKGLHSSNERNAVWYQTMHLLASTRPADAARLLDDMPDSQTKQVILNGLTEQWLRFDQASALEWIHDLNDSPRKQRVLKSAVGALARQDPRTAIELASTMKGLNKRRAAVSEVTRQWFREDASAAISWLKDQPADAFRDETLRYALPQDAGQSPAEAWAYVDQLLAEDSLSTSLERTIGNLASNFARLDLERALQWAEELPSAGAREAALEQAMYVIAREDPQRAAAMIDRGEVTTDEALHRVALKLAESDPDTAFAWISNQPSDRRPRAVARTLGDLNRLNPQAAAAQLQASATFLS